ncbi:hypothetical protein TKK_0013766 [Trichogramma kaykai]|uniref:Uncharacterized protein n=1 Tax=Trichogramma kaykai TaxID=54128 RepID=A0ABD2WGW0_9HYME
MADDERRHAPMVNGTTIETQDDDAAKCVLRSAQNGRLDDSIYENGETANDVLCYDVQWQLLQEEHR